MRLTSDELTAVPHDAESTSDCRCCGRPMYSGSGVIERLAVSVGAYWYQWSDGHEGRFVLAVAWGMEGPHGERVVVLQGRASPDGRRYGILEPAESPWDLSDIGPMLTRAEALLTRPITN